MVGAKGDKMAIGMIELRPLVLRLRDELKIGTFIETGTYKAFTTTWAADRFERVITTEFYEPNYRGAVEHHVGRANIEFIFGDSRTELSEILGRQQSPAIIWLDAHWCGNYEKSLGTPGECPVREELEAISKSPLPHIVLIDDARLFLDPPPRPHDPAQWPTFDEIRATLEQTGRKVLVWNDAIIGAPPEAYRVVCEHLKIAVEIPVIVAASNDYVNCLRPFSYLFNKHWSADQRVTVLRYDVRPPKLPPNFLNIAVGKQSDFTWSSGLKNFLRYINHPHVLLMLEDYWLTEKVDVKAIEYALSYMEKDARVVKIDLSGDRMKFPHKAHENGLVRSLDDAPYQASIQAALWRKDFLLDLLRDHETPWQFEKGGTARIIQMRDNGWDGQILGFENPPLKYVNGVGGHGNRPGIIERKLPSVFVKELERAGVLP